MTWAFLIIFITNIIQLPLLMVSGFEQFTEPYV